MPDPDYSTFTPFFRRFGNEYQREVRETYELYQQAAELHRWQGVDPSRFGKEIISSLPRGSVPSVFIPAMSRIFSTLIHGEEYIFSPPSPDFNGMTLNEFAAYRNNLQKRIRFYETKSHSLDLIRTFLVSLLSGLEEHLPFVADHSPFEIAAIHAIPNPKVVIQNLMGAFSDSPYLERELFHNTREQFRDNVAAASGFKRSDMTSRAIEPIASKLPLEELVSAYLGGTPFEDLFLTPIPLNLTDQHRFTHMHVVAPPGVGKTVLLENLFLHDVASDDPPSIVVIDSQGDLIRKISRMNLGRDVILINPKDVDNPPAINIFNINRDRLATYSKAEKEQVMAGVTQTFDYLFTGLIGTDLTAKQDVFFKFLAQLMLSLSDVGVLESNQRVKRNATILDMLNLMVDPEPYRPAIAALPPIARQFFERDFLDPKNKTFAQTRDQIRYRLLAIIQNPTLERLFSAPVTKLDLFEELNNGSIILVDTAKDFLKGASADFGKIFIALILQAIFERAPIDEDDRKPTFLYIDEAHEYFSNNIDELLTQARKYNCGIILSHQYLDQATSGLKASLAAIPTIKIAAKLSSSDARNMAQEMHTTPDFIVSQPRFRFAAHVRGVTPQAVSIAVEPGVLERAPQFSSDEYQDFLDRNRARVTYRPEAPPPQKPSEPDEDVSSKW